MGKSFSKTGPKKKLNSSLPLGQVLVSLTETLLALGRP